MHACVSMPHRITDSTSGLLSVIVERIELLIDFLEKIISYILTIKNDKLIKIAKTVYLLSLSLALEEPSRNKF